MEPPKSLRVFLDTSAWISYLLPTELNHPQVKSWITTQAQNKGRFLTSDYVLDESYTWLISHRNFHSGQKMAHIVNDLTDSKSLVVLYTDETIFHKAWGLFKKYADHKLSFTDATIAVYYQDLKLDTIATLDQGFTKIGLKTAPKL